MTQPSSPSELEARSRAIAAGFVRRWARRAGAGGWVVDGFAGAELQRAALRGEGAEPPVAEAATWEVEGVRTVVVEEDPVLLERVGAALSRRGAPVRRGAGPTECEPGEVLLVEGAFPALAPSVAAAVAGAPVLFRLGPLSARALPWSALAAMLAPPAAELLLRFPAEDLPEDARFAVPLADLPPHLRRRIEGCSALLDDPRHEWVAASRARLREAGADAARAEVADRLRRRVETACPGARVRVALPGGAPLLLVARDPVHLLELNGALRDAGLPAELPADLPPPPPPPPPDLPEALELFPLPPAHPPPPESAPEATDLDAAAEAIHARFQGRVLPYRELLGELAESGLAPEEVRAALRRLRRSGRAGYRSLAAEGAEVDFLPPPPPVVPAPSAPRRARRPRPPTDPDLFDP